MSANKSFLGRINMKKLFACLFVMAAFLLYMLPQARADVQDVQRHGDWLSGVDSHAAYMFAESMSKQGKLSVTLLPGGETSIVMLVSPKANAGVYKHLNGKTVSGKLCVDRGSRHNVRLECMLENDGALLLLLPRDFFDILLKEGRNGFMFSIEVGGQKPVISLKYALDGFSDALLRCRGWVQRFHR